MRAKEPRRLFRKERKFKKRSPSHIDRHFVGKAKREDPDAAVDVQEALVDDLQREKREETGELKK